MFKMKSDFCLEKDREVDISTQQNEIEKVLYKS